MKAETKVMRAIFGEECKDEDLCDSVSGETLRDTIFRLLGEISEKSRLPSFSKRVVRVFVLRFGLVDGQARTLWEVGDKFGLTGERIRSIEAMGLRWLRHPNYSRGLRAFFKKAIEIDRTFERGYVRPLGRGILLGDEYLDRIIEEAIPDGCYSPSGGSMLKGIHICIEIEEVKRA